MSQYQGTFKRYEKKYLLSEKKYRMLRQKLQNRLNIDKYGKVTICNIYFDTPDSLLIRTSLDKPVYKEKLRLRSYGTPSKGDQVFIELKKKYKGIVYKRRVDMELADAERYLYESVPPKKASQITREIDWVMNYYEGLVPAMYISYNRIAMYGVEDSQLRVTFDSSIIWRTEQLNLSAGVWGNQLLEEGQRLMEIKIPGAMPLWLSHILDDLELYPVSFSKYGRGYQEAQKNNQTKTDLNRRGEIRYA